MFNTTYLINFTSRKHYVRSVTLMCAVAIIVGFLYGNDASNQKEEKRMEMQLILVSGVVADLGKLEVECRLKNTGGNSLTLGFAVRYFESYRFVLYDESGGILEESLSAGSTISELSGDRIAILQSGKSFRTVLHPSSFFPMSRKKDLSGVYQIGLNSEVKIQGNDNQFRVETIQSNRVFFRVGHPPEDVDDHVGLE